MKILITGSTGLLGQALTTHLAPFHDVVGVSRYTPTGQGEGRHLICDLLDPARTRQIIADMKPDVVIHTQALSDVDDCEQHPDEAQAQNVSTLAHVTQALDGMTLLISMSTDYVFDGAKESPYDERDTPHPISVYGRSKAEAERLVLRYARAVVVRTSTLFGPGRMNFCDQIVRQARAGEPVEAFIDQVTSPTYTEDLASAMREMSEALLGLKGDRGPQVYHVANAGGCSRLTFAYRVVDLLGAPRSLVRPIPMAAQQRPAARPPSSVLTTLHLEKLIGRTLRPWDEALHAYLRQYHSLN